MQNCEQCGIEFEAKRKDAKFCSLNCRVTFNRKGTNVTDNVTLSDPAVTDNFEFTVYHVSANRDVNTSDIKEAKDRVRTAKYWYNVPLGATPVLKKGWPPVPVFDTDDGKVTMNGRQYFLWWKNEFKTQEDGSPIIHNPRPIRENVTYVQAGQDSRRWGA